MQTADPQEIAKFNEQAHRWWDPKGPSRALHELNPLRLAFVRERITLKGARVLDLGCGGGILTEALAAEGADVLGIDAADQQIEIARLHALESGSTAQYRHVDAEQLAADMPSAFDAICCMEMLEHVEAPERVLAAGATLLKPGGCLFLSTINRNARSFALAIVAAEHLLRLLPKGTHRHSMFIRPSELAAGLRAAGFELRTLEGLHYDPFRRKAWRNSDVGVNYLAHAEKSVVG
ncbi:MAG: bifunctional 2-polyprenyl-6-hydroxyphenol methylase/3-demethylubiquinol 3-O-methyltransferase UbiG [Rhodanobacteraceae bacterium]|nr:bifunctional 2-polyprenyl-6-hydroxyphenol methylase/3-demethylubiquinol 3-O-methyltransferase UbiG [Rhodanobacteraceae bacterium]MBP9153634.1 bifunctional 2-polyprenyl-6-hydroxyphenol methylase/3-demethylubiquinol 3-O-methyltransferase UbiG [Xanthomonadales bacterium]HQW80650.1 bifunctional 2-polyprenyl-6-hydroxyphenol methylase/3-demethylubiquinol 3-O-methyltransferase UbiG [Pseudomonadota bacterium]